MDQYNPGDKVTYECNDGVLFHSSIRILACFCNDNLDGTGSWICAHQGTTTAACIPNRQFVVLFLCRPVFLTQYSYRYQATVVPAALNSGDWRYRSDLNQAQSNLRQIIFKLLHYLLFPNPDNAKLENTAKYSQIQQCKTFHTKIPLKNLNLLFSLQRDINSKVRHWPVATGPRFSFAHFYQQ